MPNSGHDIKIDNNTEVSVRRCFDEGEKEVVSLTIETFEGGWFLSSISLPPRQAVRIGTALLCEACSSMAELGGGSA